MSNYPWDKIIGVEWHQKLSGLLSSDGMDNLMKFIISEYSTSVVYPPMEDVFKAFRLCPPSKMKVIILGQDPYHDGNATGLAFANHRTNFRMSPSLESIWKSCETATDTIIIDFDLTLEEWAKQGVLLLNTALTVKKFSPTSHSPYWHGFTRAVLRAIDGNHTGLHICLWGKHAKEFEKEFTKDRHFIYKANHPVAHVYSDKMDKWYCNHFQEINTNIIKQNGEDEIIIW